MVKMKELLQQRWKRAILHQMDEAVVTLWTQLHEMLQQTEKASSLTFKIGELT